MKFHKPCLQSAIDRNDIIKVATYPNDSVRYWFDADGVRHFSVYGRELKVLENACYIYVSSIQSFVKLYKETTKMNMNFDGKGIAEKTRQLFIGISNRYDLKNVNIINDVMELKGNEFLRTI
ncbi:MAG: hypothetical protein RR646_05315 [Erysipelotrichaceae bacterium]|uniref:hypothetical protein n=1 Tax=Anaerorhabdus sp. TaxID=1872524 RepID=UPI002FC7196B